MRIEIIVNPRRRQVEGFMAVSVRVPDLSISRNLDISFEMLRRYCGWRDKLSLDFLTVAALCYVIDKTVPRSEAVDGWTRELEVDLPVADPDLWNSVSGKLCDALKFLTGDIWNIGFTKLACDHWRPRRWPKRGLRRYTYQAEAVCLFSGGLDSLAGALDLLESQPDTKVLFVGHYDAAAGEQDRIFKKLRFPYWKRTQLLRVRIGHKDNAQETTLRSRSLLFLALGFYAARSYGPDIPVYACENGVIALNVPLTPSRAGSCSTRTMHPYFLDLLREIARDVGFTNSLINPLEMKTKGECVAECRKPVLLNSLALHSVSCSHAARRQLWIRKGGDVHNCGYCVPCLFRRASMHKAGIDSGEHYGFDVLQGELAIDDPGESANDLRAMVDFLRLTKGDGELAAEIMAIAPVSDLPARTAMVARGFEEVRTLVREKGNQDIQRAVQVSST